MQGTILGFDPDTNLGAISGHDGRRYDFVRIEWRGAVMPLRGAVVDFVPEGGRATQIYPLGLHGNPAEGETANTVYVLYLVSLAVGVTGIVGVIMACIAQPDAPDWVKTHLRFQIRTFWIGFLYMVISAVTMLFLIGFLGWLFTVVWVIVRCVKGMQSLTRGEPYPNPATWLW